MVVEIKIDTNSFLRMVCLRQGILEITTDVILGKMMKAYFLLKRKVWYHVTQTSAQTCDKWKSTL